MKNRLLLTSPFVSYVIGYYPTNKATDGTLRRVRVEVRGHPEYVVQGRLSYHAVPR